MNSFKRFLTEEMPGGPIGGAPPGGGMGGPPGGGMPPMGGGMPPPMGGGGMGGPPGLGGPPMGGGMDAGQQPVPVKIINVIDVWKLLKDFSEHMDKFDDLNVNYNIYQKPREKKINNSGLMS
jgi:hypothetical protein